jgi:hypothetical protein
MKYMNGQNMGCGFSLAIADSVYQKTMALGVAPNWANCKLL